MNSLTTRNLTIGLAGAIAAALLFSLACPPFGSSAAAWLVPGLLLVTTRNLPGAPAFVMGLIYGVLSGVLVVSWLPQALSGGLELSLPLVFASVGLPYAASGDELRGRIAPHLAGRSPDRRNLSLARQRVDPRADPRLGAARAHTIPSNHADPNRRPGRCARRLVHRCLSPVSPFFEAATALATRVIGHGDGDPPPCSADGGGWRCALMYGRWCE